MLELVPYLEMFQHQRTKEQIDRVYCQVVYEEDLDGDFMEDYGYIKKYYELYSETFNREHPLMMDFNMREAMRNAFTQRRLPAVVISYYMQNHSRKECHFLNFSKQDAEELFHEFLRYRGDLPLILK